MPTSLAKRDSGMPTSRSRRPDACVAAVALLGIALALSSMRRMAVTYDETSHLTAGYTYWKTGDFRMTPDHPPLAELLAALPLLPLHLHMPGLDTPDWQRGFVWTFGRKWLNRPNDVDAILYHARVPIVLLWAMGGVVAWRWARRLFGVWGGATTAALYYLCPNLIAHSRVVTTDVAAGVLFLTGLYAAVRLLERVTWSRLAGAALSLSALFLTKFSAPLILPVLVVLATLRVLRGPALAVELFGRREVEARGARASCLAGIAAAIALVGYTSIWAAYGFRYAASPGVPAGATQHLIKPANVIDVSEGTTEEERRELREQYGREDVGVWEQMVHRAPGVGRIILWARAQRLLPEAYLYGLAFTVKSTEGRNAYALGRASQHGWWWYFPLTLALKTPLATLVLLGAGAAALIAQWRDPRDLFALLSLWALLLFVGLYWFTSITGNLNIGLRHLIPALMAMYVLCGAAGAWMERARTRAGRAGVPVLMALLAATTALAWPNYISYFNALGGGPQRAWRLLADSNVDWGQDLTRLADHLRKQGEGEIKLAYFGTGRPEYYGIRASYFPHPFELFFSDVPAAGPTARFEPGTYVFSATAMNGWNVPMEFLSWNEGVARRAAGLREALRAEEQRGAAGSEVEFRRERLYLLYYAKLLDGLRGREPDEVVGGSMLIYRLNAKDVAQALGELGEWSGAARNRD